MKGYSFFTLYFNYPTTDQFSCFTGDFESFLDCKSLIGGFLILSLNFFVLILSQFNLQSDVDNDSFALVLTSLQ